MDENSVESKIAVLQARQIQMKEDVDRIYTFLRNHMEKEEEMNRKFVQQLFDLNAKFDKNQFFMKGVIGTVTVIWSVLVVAVKFW